MTAKATDDDADVVAAHAENRFFAELATHGEAKRFEKNAVFIQEGATDGAMYLIQSGWVRVFATEKDGKQIVIDEHGPGDFVGEMALDGMRRSASVIALEPVTVVALTRDKVLDYLRGNPEFSLSLIMELIRRARLATANFKSVALKDVYGRIATLLLSLAVSDGARTIIPGKLTKAEIARRVGASRDMVALIMGDLTEGGYLRKEEEGLVIARALPERW